MLVAIDTNILIWGVRGEGPDEKQKRAQSLFEELDEKDDVQIIVPTIALTEYLRPYPLAQHAEQIDAIDKRFLVLPFDTKCTSTAARLFNKGKEMRQSGIEGARNVLNADSMIIATAHAHGAQYIYSGNKDFRDLAELITTWTVKDLPYIRDLFNQ